MPKIYGLKYQLTTEAFLSLYKTSRPTPHPSVSVIFIATALISIWRSAYLLSVVCSPININSFRSPGLFVYCYILALERVPGLFSVLN